jgi:lipoate-protein ligase A
MNACRLIECPPARGEWNMAVDAALMESVASSGECCLRFYAWSEPTVSLGYFQAFDGRQAHAASRNCPLVRRSTGGGAIVHDREITYSFIVPAVHRLVARAQSLYRFVHQALVDAMSNWGLEAVIFDHQPAPPVDEEPFLCFQRRGVGDVVLSGWKIAGSAQRRRRGAVLQHGSVLLGRSSSAPELPGLVEVGGREIGCEELANAWRARLSRQCQICWHHSPLDELEVMRATQLVEEIYSRPDWTHRR